MSFRSRQAKRKKKTAIAATKSRYAQVMRGRYYLTTVKRACRCCACGTKLQLRADLVYRSDGPVTSVCAAPTVTRL
jgi:hypothetical protein